MINLFDYFEGLNVFGAGPDARAQSLLDAKLIDPKVIEAADKRSIGTGIMTGLASYLAQPKTGNYGSALPYIGKAYLNANQAAQAPFQRIADKYLMDLKIAENKRAQELQKEQDLFRENYPLTGATTQIDPNQQVNIPSFGTQKIQDNMVGSSLMGGRTTPMASNSVAPMFNTVPVTAPTANKLGVSLDQLQTTQIAPDSELVRAEQAYKAGIINFPELMSAKASLAKADEFGSASPDNIIFNKRTGEILNKGNQTNKPRVLSEAGLQNFEKTQGYKNGFYPRVDAQGNPYIYQFNKDGKLTVTDIGGSKGFSFTLNDKKDQGLSEVAIADLVNLRDDHTRARTNLPKIDSVVTALIKDKMGLDAGVYTGAFANFKLEADKFQAAVRNIKDKNPAISNTEILDMALNSDVFPLIKQLGIGARGLDTPQERDFLIAAMVGTKTMSSEALIQATLTRRNRLISTAREFNENSGSDLFKRATKQGVRGLSKKYEMSEEMLRGPMIDVSTYNGKNKKWFGKKIYKYADGTMTWAETGEIAFKPKGF